MKYKIKIVRIFSRLNVGGPAIHTILLTAGLNKNEFETVLVVGQEEKREGNMLDLAQKKGVSPIFIPELGRKISIVNDIKALFKIYKLIKKEKPDIVHTHTAKAGMLGRSATILFNFASVFKRGHKKIKLFHTFHGNVLRGYFNPIVSYVFVCIERILALFTDKVITVSEKQREEILQFKLGNRNKVIVIPLGLELSRFLNLEVYKGQLRKELKISEKTKLVGIIARLVPIKNHKMLIDAVFGLKEKFDAVPAKTKWNWIPWSSHGMTGAGVKFLIIGDGELRNELEEYVKGKGLNDEIMFLGFRNDLERIYADLDVVVLASLNEGSPVALIEAMTAGIPVVSTNIGGVSDVFGCDRERIIIEKGNYYTAKCGVLVKSQDDQGLSLALKYLLKNEDICNRMGVEGRKQIYPKYDISRLIKDMEQIYADLV